MTYLDNKLLDRSITYVPCQYCTIENGPTIICVHPGNTLKFTFTGKTNDVLNADPATTFLNILSFTYIV